MELADKQRVDFAELVDFKINDLLQDVKFTFDNKYDISCELCPINLDLAHVNSVDKSVYVMVSAKFIVKEIATGNDVTFNVNLLKLPVYQELGFKIGGNYKQVLGQYGRPSGWSFLRKNKRGELSYSAQLKSVGRASLMFNTKKQANPTVVVYTARKYNAERGNKDIPVSVFFRAISEETNESLLNKLGNGDINLQAFSDTTITSTADLELSNLLKSANTMRNCQTRQDCINVVHAVIFGIKNQASKTLAEKERNIKTALFNKRTFNLGPGNMDRLAYKAAFKNRAVNKVLAEEIRLVDEVIPRGAILTPTLLDKIDNSMIDQIAVEYNKTTYTLCKFSIFGFRALGYYLADDVILSDGSSLSKHTKLGLQELSLLNNTKLTNIKVLKNVNDDVSITITRRLNADTLTIEDLLTAYSIFANNVAGYDSVDDEYALTNRVIDSFSSRVLTVLDSHVTEVVGVIEKGLERIDTDADATNSLMDLLGHLKFKLNVDKLLEMIKETDSAESQLSDLNNTMAFVSKDYKITTDIATSAVTDDLIKIQDSQIGRLDLYDSPESNKVGRVHHKTLLSEENEYGYSTAPFLRVKNGVVTDEIVRLTAADEHNEYIAEWCETFVNEDGSPKTRVKARYNGVIVTADVSLISYQEYSMLQNVGPATSTIPFIQHSNGKRITMGCGQQTQAVITLHNSRANVGTGSESFLQVGRYTAKDIIKQFYDNSVSIYPELQKHADTLLSGSLQLDFFTEEGDLRKYVFTLDTLKQLQNADLLQEVRTTPEIKVPHNQRNVDGGVVTYRVNTAKSIYSGDDIVLYSADYDITEYQVDAKVNFGKLDVPKDIFKTGLALGQDLCVAYKTFGGSTIDDSCVINRRLVSDQDLSSLLLFVIEEELFSDESKEESFSNSSQQDYTYFTEQGLPKVGTYLYPGDPVICKTIKYFTSTKRSKKDKRRTLNTRVSYKHLGINQEGQVVGTTITEERGRTIASVTVALRADVEVGDKVAGRYGNKCVVSRIMPEEEMPYDPETGITVDMILDPEGVPSRMNISQLYEGPLAMACYKSGKKAVVSQFNPEGCDYVHQMIDETDSHPKMLIDGRTGLYFDRPINLVFLHTYKLVHMVRKKAHAIGLHSGRDAVTLQPKKGGKFNGGQKFGEMESWCLEGTNCPKVLQELQTVLSDDLEGQRRALKKIQQCPTSVLGLTGSNHNDSFVQALFLALGAEISTGFDSAASANFYDFRPLSDSRILSLKKVAEVRHARALHDTGTFGEVATNKDKMNARSNWGYITLHSKMISPLWVHKGNLHHLFLEQELGKKSYNVCKATLLEQLIKSEVFIRPIDNYSALNVVKASDLPEVDEEIRDEFSTGFDALFNLFEFYDLRASYEKLCEKLETYERKYITKAPATQKVGYTNASALLAYLNQDADLLEEEVVDDSVQLEAHEYDTNTYRKLVKTKAFVKDFLDRHESLTNYLFSYYPVIPAVYRPLVDLPGMIPKNDFDQHYKQILACAEALETDVSEENRRRLYEALDRFLGFAQDTDTTNIPIITWFLGTKSEKKNHGKIRETVQSKVILRSGRSVIVPMIDTTLDALHIGIPFILAVRAWEEQLISYLSDVFGYEHEDTVSTDNWRQLLYFTALNNRSQFTRVYEMFFEFSFAFAANTAFDKFRGAILEFLEGTESSKYTSEKLLPQIVIAGRQPSLHRFSIRAYCVKVVDTRAIQINTLTCPGYNADFDGDQMWFSALLSREAQEEAYEKMSTKREIINPKNNSVILEMSQDVPLGIYYATMLENNKLSLSEDEKRKVPVSYTMEQLETDLLNRVIKPFEIVAVNYEGRLFVSTAGRIYFNSLIPSGLSGYETDGTRRAFTNPLGLIGLKEERYYNLQFDGLITAGKGAGDIVTISLSDVSEAIYWQYQKSDDAEDVVKLYQKLVNFGFIMADYSGLSISLEDLDEIAASANKERHLSEFSAVQERIEQDYQLGLFSDKDKQDAIFEEFNAASDAVKTDLFAGLSRNNNIFIMFDSGARGNASQIAQTCGMLGILDKAEGESLQTPIISNYHEGLSSFDNQMMSYSTRMGMASTQNKTADAGYATRQGIYMTAGLDIVEWDCGKKDWWFDVLWGNLIPEKSVFIPNETYCKKFLVGKKVWCASADTLKLFNDDLDNTTITETSCSYLADGFHSMVLEGRAFKANLDKLGDYVGYKIDKMIPQLADIDTMFVNEDVLKRVDEISELVLVEPKEITITPDSIIGFTLADDDERCKEEFCKFLEDGVITDKCKSILLQKHLLEVRTTLGVFQFRYKMTEACRSLLRNREARNLKYLKVMSSGAGLTQGPAVITHVITEKTLDYVEDKGISRIEARILLDCLSGSTESLHRGSTHGCCARCYGLKYSSMQYPKIGESVGIEAAQAVGEPASQLTLNLINKGGAAGESVASGVEIFESLLKGNIPESTNYKTGVATHTGYLEVKQLNEFAVVRTVPKSQESDLCTTCKSQNDGQCPRVAEAPLVANAGLCLHNNRIAMSQLLYTDGMLVHAGDPITKGYVNPDNIIRVDSEDVRELVRAKQIAWLLNYFNTFQDNNIYINCRHFEIFTRLQNLLFTVLKSEDSRFVPGKQYEYGEIISHLDKVTAVMTLSKQSEVIQHNSGALAALSFADVTKVIANLVTSGHKSYRNSALGLLNVGQDVTKPHEIKYVGLSTGLVRDVQEEPTSYESFNMIATREELDNDLAALASLDLDSMFVFDEDTSSDANSLDVTVLLDGITPVPDVSIVFQGEETQFAVTDAFGRAHVDGLFEGSYTIKIKSDEYRMLDDMVVNVPDSNFKLIEVEKVDKPEQIIEEVGEVVDATIAETTDLSTEEFSENSYETVEGAQLERLNSF